MASRIEVWPVERCKPFARNPRVHGAEQVAKIAASIATFGFNAPLLVDDDGTIIAGHGRLLAAQRLALPEVPVVVLTHLSESERMAYVIADNKIANEARWDERVLAGLLQDLDADGMDVSLTGFDDVDLQRLTDDLDAAQMGALSGDGEVEVPAVHPAVAQRVTIPAPAAAPAPPPEPLSIAPQSDYVPLSIVMTPDQRNSCYEAIRKAKADHGTDNSGEALFIIARRYLDG